MKVSLVPAEHLDAAWPQVEGYLEKAVAYTDGRYEVEDVRQMLLSEQYLLWVAFDTSGIKAAVVTCFVEYPRKRALHVMFTGGVQMEDWMEPMLDIVRRWAIDNKCDVFECATRRGWERVFKESGARVLWQTLEMPVQGV